MSAPDLNEMQWMVSVFGNEKETFCVHAKLQDFFMSQNETSGHHNENQNPAVMNNQIAEEWTRDMENADGTHGAHWTMDKIKQLVDQKPELQKFDLSEVFAVINMMYSDYCEVAKKLNVHNMDFYVYMTKAWLEDKDAGAGKAKTAAYYEYVVK